MAAFSNVSNVSSLQSMALAHLEGNQDFQDAFEGVNAAVTNCESTSYHNQLSKEELNLLAARFVSQVKAINASREEYEEKISVRTCAENLRCIDFQGRRVLWLSDTEIASGGECTVFYGIASKGVLCAVKQRNDCVPKANWNRMAQLLEHVSSSSHVVHVLGANDNFIVEEYVERSLSDFLKEIEAGDDEAVKRHEATNRHKRCISQWNEQVLQGLADIHAAGIIHSDPKLENLLIGKDDVIRFTDFGYAVKAEEKIHGGTSSYYAPEQIRFFSQMMLWGGDSVKKLEHQDRVDVWGTMLVLAKMNRWCLSDPFEDRLISYETKQREMAYNAQQARGRYLGREAVEKELAHYAKESLQYQKEMIKERKEAGANAEGLFSDLEPTDSLEKVLVEMSYFDPSRRISSADALALYRTERS